MKKILTSKILTSKILAPLMIMGLVSGCAAAYRPIPFDHATSGISTIQVVDNAMPKLAQVRKLATNGQNIASSTGGLGLAGLVVGLAAAGIEASIANDQNTKINGALASQKFDGETLFEQTLQDDLRAQNYQVSTTDIARPDGRGFVVVAPQANAQPGSAVLDVDGGGYGYQTVGGTKKWRPYVVLAVKMYDAKDPAKVLLDNQVEYDAVVPGALTVSIPVDDTYSFDSAEDIQAHPEKATEGLKNAIIASAHATAQLLK